MSDLDDSAMEILSEAESFVSCRDGDELVEIVESFNKKGLISAGLVLGCVEVNADIERTKVGSESSGDWDNTNIKRVQGRKIVLDDDDEEECQDFNKTRIKRIQGRKIVLADDDEEEVPPMVCAVVIQPASAVVAIVKIATKLAPTKLTATPSIHLFDEEVYYPNENTHTNEQSKQPTANLTKPREDGTRLIRREGKDWKATKFGYKLPLKLGDALYDYQRTGVEFIFDCWATEQAGGVLADDMGLGKTMQTCAALCGLYFTQSRDPIRTLLVLPLSLVETWKSSLQTWVVRMCPDVSIRVEEFHGAKKLAALDKIKNRGGILITTYETCTSNTETLSKIHWDVLVADEATRIKNYQTGIFKSLRALADKSKRRLALTGTPFQNNLLELWALFNFVSAGTLLGDRVEFERHFVGHIEKSYNIAIGTNMSRTLHAVILPFLLRREKSVLFQPASAADILLSAKTYAPSFTAKKIDLYVWITLSSEQRALYESFLKTPEVREALNKTQSPLAAISVLKNICDDTRLVAAAGLSSSAVKPTTFSKSATPSSAKLDVLVRFIEELCCTGGHKVLVFSHSKRMIHFAETAVASKLRGINTLTVDGDINVDQRSKIVKAFNRDEGVEGSKENDQNVVWDVLFMTSGVGALGLDVTGADRVILIDPHWNPAIDEQSVDRAFRLGQTKNVVCYRFVTVGTVEEKMTRMQLRKISLARNVLMAEAQRLYSTKDDLKDLFSLAEDDAVDTLYHKLKDSLDDVHESVKSLLGNSEGRNGEILNQIAALSGDVNSESESFLRLHASRLVLGVTDRAALFSQDEGIFVSSMNELSSNDRTKMDRVVEDALGWITATRKG